ncbi:hypothetical protein KSP39_PZI022705 [Platanthera zijinensis]|uniref:Uncharacterized protein n=1 Tax=Platanthera zijinensis TaxID=2320716 RepID=A0AAP0AVD1_9ASPA
MSDSGSPDHFFSALEILSAAAAAASASPDRVNHQAPTYADESILICSLPDTPLSSAPSAAAIASAKQTADPPSSNAPHPLPTRNPRSVISRRGMGAKIRSYDSDEENQGGSKNVSPSFGPEISAVSGLSKDADESKEEMLAMEEEEEQQQQKFTFLDIVKMMSEKPNERFEDTDILEVAAMKGIHFPPPRWWKPGGYGDEVLPSLLR